MFGKSEGQTGSPDQFAKPDVRSEGLRELPGTPELPTSDRFPGNDLPERHPEPFPGPELPEKYPPIELPDRLPEPEELPEPIPGPEELPNPFPGSIEFPDNDHRLPGKNLPDIKQEEPYSRRDELEVNGMEKVTDHEHMAAGVKQENLSEADSNDEPQEKKGGSYKEVKKNSNGETHEVHHMPADSASNLERDDGPAIKMETEDHRQTASYGSSKEAREYRETQRKLLEEGKFREALQMDIDDLHEKFGDKYDDAIGEMLKYVDQLEQEGKI